MTRRTVLVAWLVIGLALSWRPVSADPIRITAGHLEIGTSTGTLSLQGERGFTLAGGVSVNDGVFQLWLRCQATPECVPGSEMDLGANWAGSSLRSTTVTLDGETFTQVGGLLSNSSASVRFIGTAVAPAFAGDTATVVVPFRFQGEFQYAAPGFATVVESLVGAGTVSIFLQRSQGFPAWQYTAARYEFSAVPEPGTILLTAAGLALTARRLRRRRPPAAARAA